MNASSNVRRLLVLLVVATLTIVAACGNPDDRDFSDLTPENQEGMAAPQ